MNLRHLFPTMLVAVALASGLTVSRAPAQAGADLGQMVTNSLTHMNNGEWPQALQLLTEATKRYGKNAKTLFGPKFGVIYYRQGYCALKLGKFDDAMKAFEKCYKDFPNDGARAEAGGGNLYHKRALLKWGDAALGAEDYEQAIRLYKKFLDERDRTRDKFPKGAFYINMSVCYFKLGKIPEGNENLEIAIKNKETFPTPDAGIVAGFQALVGAVIDKRNEQALLDFVAKNRGDIVIEPFEMAPYSRLFMKLAADAVNAEMDRAALLLYQLVPSTDVTIEDLNDRIARLGTRRGVIDGARRIELDKLKADADALKKGVTAGKTYEATALAAMAFIHETEFENVRPAFAAYQQLEFYYKEDKKKREENLYNLVRTSSLVGEVLLTEEYGRNFLKTFPESKHVPAVRRLMLTSLFFEGHYEECIEIAEVMLPRLQKGKAGGEHDICLYVLGGSYYYLGQYRKARPHLDKHVEMYPTDKDTRFHLPVRYFQASNLSRLQIWQKAATLLDAFMNEYPEPPKPDGQSNPFYSFALFDRANCHYAEDEYEPALALLNRLENEYPDAAVIDMAYNLKGNVLQTEDQYDEAEAYYKKALVIAERRLNRGVAAESLYYMVALLGEEKRGKEDNPRIKDAVPFADKFWELYADSPYRSQVAVAQLAALDADGRGEEALERLRDVIGDMASDPNAFFLEESINSYTDAYLAKYSADDLKEHYYNFPGIGSNDKAALALLRIAVISVFETVVKEPENDQQKTNATAMIKVLFQELKRDFDPKDLTPYILVRLGDYLRTRTSAPRQALPYYQEALDRKDPMFRFPALFGRSDVLAGGNREEVAKAAADLQIVFDESTDKNERERSLYRIAQLQMKKEDFDAAQETAKLYLDRKGLNFTQHAPQMGLLLAQTFDERGMVNDALAMYAKVWSAHMGYVSVSAPAMMRWMELAWDRDLPAAEGAKTDRQGAYEFGWNYIDATGRFFDKMTSEEQEMWREVQKLVDRYENTPGIKSMAAIKAEKAKR